MQSLPLLRCLLPRNNPKLSAALQLRRYLTTRYDPSKTRNLAVVAHIDSGKTTLTESILLKSSYLSSSGSVDTGSTTTDFLPAERERGITIQSASIPVKWKDWTFNLIDTPGHADFGMEVESASRVVDGAVVLIDSVEGVEAQTKGVWRQLDRYGVPTRILFMNKLDRPGASLYLSMLSLLSHRIHPKPMALTLPIASFDPEYYTRAEPGVEGLVDLVKWEVWKWDTDGTSSRHPLPMDAEGLKNSGLFPVSHPIVPHLVPARVSLIENLAIIPASTILPHLRDATLRSDVLPVLCGSAIKNIGTEVLMDYAGELLASPLDVQHEKQSDKSPVRALAWKVAWDKKKGWMTFVRVYSGTMTRQSVLMNSSRNIKERISKLLLLYASNAEEVEELPFGSVGVILGLKHTRTGDTLVSMKGKSTETSTVPDITPPPAVMSASIIPQSHSDLEPVEAALHALVRTDPSVRTETQEGQILVHGLGALHLEIVEGRLRDEWNVRFEFGRRRVSFREGPSLDFPRSPSWDTSKSGQFLNATVSFALRPLASDEAGDPAWDGNVVLREDGKPLVAPDSSHDANDPYSHIAQGMANTLSNSPNTSLPISRHYIKVQAFQPPPGGPVSLLAGASAVILRNLFEEVGMGTIMEPFILLRISVGEEALGKVIKDLIEHGGEVHELAEASLPTEDDEVTSFSEEGLYIPPKWLSPSTMSSTAESSGNSRLRRFVHGVAPLSRMLDYSTRLRALSGGHGQFEMAPAGFRVVDQVRQLEILREIGRA
ncbi:hypothetical protein EW146_g5504 [Bondarzewia mesenterica]|uniref:Tr-type G domain-containing protein n=1 Tax=Bondarzewia mesenterica TaxID=1095465 RepID=A0A4S4LX15_9AGAM|nr:hypothetical protein EW146_g5504 [Bondarzewia mesenterica]